MLSECSIEKLERNRSDKSAQGLAWHIYYYLVSYRTFTTATCIYCGKSKNIYTYTYLYVHIFIYLSFCLIFSLMHMSSDINFQEGWDLGHTWDSCQGSSQLMSLCNRKNYLGI